MTFHSTNNPTIPHSHHHILNMINTTTSNMTLSPLFSNKRFLIPEIQILEILLALVVFVAINSFRQRKLQGLPSWPFVGMLPSLILGLRTNLYEWMSNVLCRQKGTFTFKGPWFTNLNCVITSDPRNLEHLLKTKFSNYPKGGYFRDTMGDLLGNGIFSADDDMWQKQRKTASIEFHSSKFRQMTIESLFNLVHERLLPILKETSEKSLEIDLQDVLLRLTFDNVCMIAFGVDPGCLRLGLPNIPFAKAFEDATEGTLMRFVTPTFIWKTMRNLDLGFEKNLRKSIEEVDEFADDVIRTRKEELSVILENGKQRSDLLTIFMGLKDENDQPFSDKFLRDICVNFILAGRDTSSVALSWFFWLLGKNPEVEEKILEEIYGIIVKRDNEIYRENELRFRPEEVKKMDYLQAALSEALRLYPSVPYSGRAAPFTIKFF